MELWRFWNRIKVLSRKYDCNIIFRVHETDCIYITFNRGPFDSGREVRWNFMKTSEWEFFDILENELKMFIEEINSYRERVGV